MTRPHLLLLLLALCCAGCAGDTTGDDPGSGTPPDPTVPDGSVLLTDFRSAVQGNDWRPAFQAAFRAADRIVVPEGSYSFSTLFVPSGKTIEGAGSGTVFTPLGNILFRVEGSAGDEIPVASDIADFSNRIEVSRADGFAPGDLVVLKSQRNCMFREDCGEWTLGQTTKNGRTCFFGELLTLASVSGRTLTATTNTLFPYYRNNAAAETVKEGFTTRPCATVQRIESVRDAHLRNFTIRGTAACAEVIRLKWAEECSVENVAYKTDAVPDATFMVLKITLSRDCKAVNCRSEFSSALITRLQSSVAKDYAHYSTYNNFRIISAQDCGFENCSDNFASHAFNITYSDGGIPSVRCRVRACRAVNSVWAGVVSQQCTPWSELSGNTVERSGQGVMAGCRGSKVTGNTVSTHLPFSTDYYYTRIARGGTAGVGIFEGYARDCQISGNTVEGFYTGIIVLDGYESLNIFDRAGLLAENNTVTGCAQGFHLYRNEYNTTRDALGITLRDNRFKGPGNTVQADKQRETFGIRIDPYSAEAAVASNTVAGYAYGLYMDSFPDRIAIDGNDFSDGRYGIFLRDVSAAADPPAVRLHEAGNTFTDILTPRSGLGQPCVQTY